MALSTACSRALDVGMLSCTDVQICKPTFVLGNICTSRQNYQLRRVGPASSGLSLRYGTLLSTDRAAIHGLHPHDGACCWGCQLRTSKYAVSLPAEYPSP